MALNDAGRRKEETEGRRDGGSLYILLCPGYLLRPPHAGLEGNLRHTMMRDLGGAGAGSGGDSDEGS